MEDFLKNIDRVKEAVRLVATHLSHYVHLLGLLITTTQNSLHPICPGKIRLPMALHLPLFIPHHIRHSHRLAEHPLALLPVSTLERRDVAERVDAPPQRLLAEPVRPLDLVLPDGHREPRQPVGQRVAEDLHGVRLDLRGEDVLPRQVAEARVVVPHRQAVHPVVEVLRPGRRCRPGLGLVV